MFKVEVFIVSIHGPEFKRSECTSYSVADLHSKILDAHPPGVQILSISCSFWENLTKSYVGTPQGVGTPSSGKS